MPKNSPFFINIAPGIFTLIGFPKIASWDIKTRPKKPKKGTLGFNTDNNNLEYFDGSSWFRALMD